LTYTREAVPSLFGRSEINGEVRPYRFSESVPMPLWFRAILLAGIGSVVAGMIAPLVDPAKSWIWYATYYPTMAVALAALVVVFGSFRRLRIAVTDDRVEFGFGVFRRSLPLASIQSCEVKRYNWLPYGGWGIRFSTRGRRAYSMPGVPRGVEITVGQGKKARRYFVSSTQPERFASSLSG
jgi:hypothetical protein